MVSSPATTVEQYLSALPADRRAAIERVRDTVNAHVPDGYTEGMQYGMIGWCVPLARFSATHNGQPLALAALAAQKSGNSLYLMSVYGSKELEARLRAGFAAAGKKLDMGKSCVRFKRAEDLALEAIADAIGALSVEDYVARYQEIQGATKTAQREAKKQPAAKAPAKKKPAAKKRPAAKAKRR